MSQTSNPSSAVAGFNPRAAAQLFKLDVMDMFNAWNAEKPLRTGFPHASNILAPEAEFCLRKLVLMAVYPEEAKRPPVKPWDTLQNARFKHGWGIHEKYQGLTKRYGRVIYTDGEAELDLTHFDETRLIYWSPDEIINHNSITMPVEIKGYKAETFDEMDEQGDPPEAAHKQVNFYMHLMQYQYGLILVENKNTQEIKTWCVEYDLELVQPYLDRMHKFKLHYIQVTKMGKEPPARKCSKSSDRLAEKCEMCQFCFSH
ncbi:hypothetical protein ccbrp13_56240 [Ktedonobacteria bacterium brp13]|nr:hypothetical protein ccbrp13_56240 [Ktedonobacteria bacterium brp13]